VPAEQPRADDGGVIDQQGGAESAPDLARLAGVFADRSRAAMCLSLLNGRAWTAVELARQAGIARSTATEHINLLVGAGVLSEQYQGRHRYVRLADDDVAELIEALTARAPQPRERPRGLRAVTADAALARARTCYDHLAGSLGVALTDAMLARRLLSRGSGWAFTPSGLDWLGSVGVDVAASRSRSRPPARACLDWTERREHLAGSLGAALCRRYFDAGWIERVGRGRAVRVTAAGQDAFAAAFGLRWPVPGG
jgi:DNA-binding transcriptional ArsR family regulator